MRFSEFLRTTVLISAASASLLAVLTVVGSGDAGDNLVLEVGVGWWLVSAAIGTRLGRRQSISGAIGTLLASARTRSALPELNPSRTVLNRLWPLLLCTIGAGALSFIEPQVPAIAAGFAIIWALAWRRQPAAVTAIEERDGARFYIEHTSPLKPIKLVRTPGFRSNLMELDGEKRSPPLRRSA